MTAVTGLSHRRDGKRTWRTVAYATADGIRLWESIFRLPDVKMGSPQGVFVGNENVLVVGNVQRPASGARPIPAVVIAYNRSNGSEHWTKQIQPDQYRKATPGAIVHSSGYDPVNDALYLGLQVDETPTQNSMGVLAMSASDGDRLWRSSFVSPTGEEGAHPYAMDIAADGSTIYIGGSFNTSLRFVLAFATSDGSLLWSSDVTSRQSGLDALSVSPSDARIYGAGSWAVSPGQAAYRFLAFSLHASDGGVRWKSSFPSSKEQSVGRSELAVSPDGSTIYATGSIYSLYTDPDFYTGPSDILTIAYDAASGDLVWSSVRGGPGSEEFPVSVGFASGHVIVCGTTAHRDTYADLTCLAYAP